MHSPIDEPRLTGILTDKSRGKALEQVSQKILQVVISL